MDLILCRLEFRTESCGWVHASLGPNGAGPGDVDVKSLVWGIESGLVQSLMLKK